MRKINISDKTYSDLTKIGRKIHDDFAEILGKETSIGTPEDVIPYLIGYYNKSEEQHKEARDRFDTFSNKILSKRAEEK